MNYAEFKEQLLNSQVRIFHISRTIDSPLLYPILRKIASYVWHFGFLPPGEIFSILTDDEVLQLDYVVNSINRTDDQLQEPEDIESLNRDMFNATVLVQIFLCGEGDVEVKKNVQEMKLYLSILTNLIKTEKIYRKGFGQVFRQNYSFFDIDKEIFRAEK